MLYVKNLVSERSGCAVANQFVIETGKEYYFQSYSSLVVKVKFSEHSWRLALGPDWDYSRTTMKHLHAFLREYWDCSWTGTADDLRKMIRKGLVKYCDTEQELEEF